MTDFPRLIEHAFSRKQASPDSVQETKVWHGHISTLHICPGRRALAQGKEGEPVSAWGIVAAVERGMA